MFCFEVGFFHFVGVIHTVYHAQTIILDNLNVKTGKIRYFVTVLLPLFLSVGLCDLVFAWVLRAKLYKTACAVLIFCSWIKPVYIQHVSLHFMLFKSVIEHFL